MGRRWKSRTYLRVRGFVDRNLLQGIRTYAHLLGPIPLVVVGGARSYLDRPAAIIAWTGAALIGVAWTSFVAWRGWRLLRATTIRGDRRFDQRDKFRLSPEYQASESILTARRRPRG